MAVTISANLDERDAEKARTIARREHRSISNFVANAVAVFSDLPKELRDGLLELRAAPDRGSFRQLTREMAALAARHRFDRAAQRVARGGRFDPDLAEASDLEILEAATAMTPER